MQAVLPVKYGGLRAFAAGILALSRQGVHPETRGKVMAAKRKPSKKSKIKKAKPARTSAKKAAALKAPAKKAAIGREGLVCVDDRRQVGVLDLHQVGGFFGLASFSLSSFLIYFTVACAGVLYLTGD